MLNARRWRITEALLSCLGLKANLIHADEHQSYLAHKRLTLKTNRLQGISESKMMDRDGFRGYWGGNCEKSGWCWRLLAFR